MTEQLVLRAALAYARMGWAVFPCNPRTKQPLVRGDVDAISHKPIPGTGGLKKATTNEDQIRAWWEQFPKAMIGVPTGQNIGCFVVDIDAGLDEKTGRLHRAEDILAALEAEIGTKMPQTWRSRTPRGGWHLFSTLPKDGSVVRNRAGIVPRVDIRGEGGYVILPPSVRHDGAPYVWEVGPTLTESASLDHVLEPLSTLGRPGGTQSSSAHPRPSSAYGETALAREIAALRNAAEGTRNDSLFQSSICLAQLVAAQLLDERSARGALADVIRGWPNQRKSRGTIESGFLRGLREPRRVDGRGDHVQYNEARSRPPVPTVGEMAVIGHLTEELGLVETIQRELDASLSVLSHTDLGNAERLAMRMTGHLIWVRSKGWYHWDGRQWQKDNSEAKIKLASQYVARAIQDEAAALRGTTADVVVDVRYRGTKHEQQVMLSDRLAAWGRCSEDHRHLGAMMRQAAPRMAVEPGRLDADPYKINVRNGTLVVSRSALEADPIALKKHEPSDYITKMVEAEYDPEATCPTYDAFMQKVQPDIGTRRFLSQWGGIALTGDISEQKLVFFWGKGRNGKTTLLEAWANVIGGYACTLPIETFMDSGRVRNGGQATPDLALLPGVRFVHTDEPAKNARLSESLVKLLTGGDTIQARELNKGFFSFKPCFKLTMSGNYRPKIDGGEASQGIWRRWVLVRWGVTIADEEVDKHLSSKLKQEASGILNRLLDGIRDWIDHGLQIPADVSEATELFRKESDLLGRFLGECTVVDEEAKTSNGDLYDVFVAWAKANGEALWRKKGLTRAMQERGYVQARGDERYWAGFRLTKVAYEFGDTPAAPDEGDEYDGDTEITDKF